jgi:PAS domain-containing protein
MTKILLLLLFFEPTEGFTWTGFTATVVTGIAVAIAHFIQARRDRKKAKSLAAENTDIPTLIDGITDVKVKLAITTIYALVKTQKKAQLAELKHYALVELMGVPFWESNEEGLCIYASDELAEVIGVDKSEILKNKWLSCVLEEDRLRVATNWRESVAEKRPFYDEYTFVHRSTKTGKITKYVTVAGRSKLVMFDDSEYGFIGTLAILDTEIVEVKE